MAAATTCSRSTKATAARRCCSTATSTLCRPGRPKCGGIRLCACRRGRLAPRPRRRRHEGRHRLRAGGLQGTAHARCATRQATSASIGCSKRNAPATARWPRLPSLLLADIARGRPRHLRRGHHSRAARRRAHRRADRGCSGCASRSAAALRTTGARMTQGTEPVAAGDRGDRRTAAGLRPNGTNRRGATRPIVDYAHPINFNVGRIDGGEWTSSVPCRCVLDDGAHRLLPPRPYGRRRGQGAGRRACARRGGCS